MSKFLSTVHRVLRGSFSTRHWYVFLFIDASIDDLIAKRNLGRVIRIEPANPFRYFWADPSFRSNDQDGFEILVEQYDRFTGRGSIESIRVGAGSELSSKTILKSSHHLAYPTCTIVNDQEILMTDGCSPSGPVIGTHEGLAGLMAEAMPRHLTDPQLAQDGESHLFMVGTNWLVDERCRGEVYQLTAEDSDDPWKLVACGEGSSWARGGGTIDVQRGLRAVQNSEGPYGLYVDLFSIDGWPNMSESRLKARVTGSLVGCAGVHTVSWDKNGPGVLLDGWQRRFDVLGWLWHLRELAHLRRCRGQFASRSTLSRHAWVGIDRQGCCE